MKESSEGTGMVARTSTQGAQEAEAGSIRGQLGLCKLVSGQPGPHNETSASSLITMMMTINLKTFKGSF